MPSLAAGAHRCGKLLAMLVGARQATEIGALTHSDAGHEKRHIRLLRSNRSCRQHDKTSQPNYAQSNTSHLNTFRDTASPITHGGKNTRNVPLFRYQSLALPYCLVVRKRNRMAGAAARAWHQA